VLYLATVVYQILWEFPKGLFTILVAFTFILFDDWCTLTTFHWCVFPLLSPPGELFGGSRLAV
jgi:hypothetical protein